MTATKTMVVASPMYVVLPAEDLARAKAFWEDKVGFEFRELPTGIMGMAGDGTGMFMYERERTKAEHTVALFRVDGLEAAMAELKSNGVVFEEYPGMGMVDGVATMPDGSMAAWFTDTEGNIINLVQM
jgi:predicted enzyme related to lactoylglutathione lyase